jgi:type VI secretion system secreted protein VgrG
MGSSSYVHGDTSLFTLTTPLGKDKLLLKGFTGSEGMSRLFRFDLDLLSEDPSIDYTQIIGKSVTIAVTQADATPRYISGIISRFGQGGADETFTAYRAEMVPWLWLLTRTADCRIFQSMTVVDIIKKIFTDLGFNDFTDATKGTYQALDYCVQYRETAFNFVSRLMEEYGIFYFFQHAQGSHTLVFGDDPSANADCPGQNQFRFYFQTHDVLDEDVVDGWQVEQELRTGKCTLTDYNFETPGTSLLTSTATIDTVGGNSQFDTYDYPGDYLTKSDGTSLTKIRMQEEEAVHLVISGTSDARSMVSGYKFTLTDHYRADMNASYLLTEIEHQAHTSGYGSRRGSVEEHYSNSFRCIPASVPFRPLRVTPHPTIAGPQPAVVVGPSGEEIYTDKYGRVKVQFFWDRVGQNNESSSCWIRVSQLFAGKSWGAMFLPRIGQEVIVDFLEGDPDQPLITGRVYNADQTTPGTLPDKMNVSGWRTHSTKGGGDHDANVLAFDDTKGSEVFYMRAEKDMAIRVQNNEDTHVMNNQTITVDQDRTETVTKGNESVTIKQGTRTHTVYGNESLTVQSGNRAVEVQQGNDDHKVDMGNRSATISMGNDSVTVSMGNQSTTISMGNQTTTVSMGSISTTAMQSITLTVGPSSISITPTGVTISGIMININGTAMVSSSAPMIQESADALLNLSGAITMINCG